MVSKADRALPTRSSYARSPTGFFLGHAGLYPLTHMCKCFIGNRDGAFEQFDLVRLLDLAQLLQR